MDHHQPQVSEPAGDPDTVDEKEQSSIVTEESLHTTDSSVEEELEARATEKANAIRQACDLRDFDALVSYATSEGGFLNDDIRRVACKSL